MSQITLTAQLGALSGLIWVG